MLTWIREHIKNTFSRLHTPVYRLTAGRVAGHFRGIPILLLTTIGRKSSEPHTWPLLYFGNQGRYVLIASNWGQDHHPAWLLNLRENPLAAIQIGRRKIPVMAQEARGEERDRLWQGAVQAYPGYERYQQRTDRKIPVVILVPR